MGLSIVYSKIALQVWRRYTSLKQDSPYYATKERDAIRAAIQKLKLNSLSYKQFEEATGNMTREFVFKNYRIIYDIVTYKQINILTIHHHARLIGNNPAFEDEK